MSKCLLTTTSRRFLANRTSQTGQVTIRSTAFPKVIYVL